MISIPGYINPQILHGPSVRYHSPGVDKYGIQREAGLLYTKIVTKIGVSDKFIECLQYTTLFTFFASPCKEMQYPTPERAMITSVIALSYKIERIIFYRNRVCNSSA